MGKKLKKPSRPEGQNILVIRTEQTPVKSLRTFHKNPRIGNIPEIAKSLHVNGQFKPIIVNIGTHTGRPNEILAGNHTYKAARTELSWDTADGSSYVKPAWDHIYASFVDVDEDRANSIVLADNKTADDGTYDDKILAELFASLPEIEGTGYSKTEIDDLLENIDVPKVEAPTMSLDDLRGFMPGASEDSANEIRERDNRVTYRDDESEDERENAVQRGAGRTNYDDDTDIEEVEPSPTGPDPDDLLAELQGMLEIREEMLWKGKNFFEVPDLREDMMVQDFPTNIQTWAGKDVTPDDGKKWFFYNYGLGGATGLPLDRTILAFNTHDDKFENWWETPAYYAAKLISGGLRNAVAPDFSFYHTMPRYVHLQGVYRSQWIARFLQEAGVRIIPRVQFDDAKSLEFNMLGIPKNPPYLTCSVQNFGTEDLDKKEDEAQVTKLLQACVDKLEPTRGLIVYGGNPGKRVLENLNLHGAEPIWVENYAAVRRGKVFDKKVGLGGKSAKEKKEIRERARKAEAERLGISVEELSNEVPDNDEE